MRRCVYCGAKCSEEGKCPGCQAPAADSRSVSQIIKGEPFHYKGYVVWCLVEDWVHDTVEYLFYLGDRLVERFTVSRDVLRHFVPENCDTMPFIWDLFLVAQGEEEVLRVVEQNTIKPAIFEITRKPSAEEEWTTGLSYGDLCTAIASGRRVIGYKEEN